jgi:putative membrane protein
MGAVALLAVSALFAAVPAWAHGPDAAGGAAARVPSWQWNLEPWLLAPLLLAAVLYAAGVARLWLQAGAGRGILRWRVAAFVSGWLALAAALVSPLDALGSLLFSAHMVQHELLMVAAAPLLVLGRPLAAWTWALAPRWRHAIGHATHWPWLAWGWRRLTQPLHAWALHALALWLWHLPQLFDAALRSEGWHVLQHASFLGTALLFWWAVLGGDPRARGSGFALAYLFTTMMHTAALGALLALAPTAWYAGYVASAGALGVDPVQDQQLGGLVMWVPGGVAYLAAGLVLVARLLARPALNRASAARPGPTR